MPCLIQRKNGTFYAVFRCNGKQVWRSTFTKDREAALQVMASLEPQFVSWRDLTILKYREKLLPLLKGQNMKGTIDLYDLSLRQFAEIIGNKTPAGCNPI